MGLTGWEGFQSSSPRRLHYPRDVAELQDRLEKGHQITEQRYAEMLRRLSEQPTVAPPKPSLNARGKARYSAELSYRAFAWSEARREVDYVEQGRPFHCCPIPYHVKDRYRYDGERDGVSESRNEEFDNFSRLHPEEAQDAERWLEQEWDRIAELGRQYEEFAAQRRVIREVTFHILAIGAVAVVIIALLMLLL